MARFEKGRSGNPGGRRRKDQATFDLIQEMNRWLAEKSPEGKLSNGAVVMQAIGAAAKAGDVNAAKELWNRCYGRVPTAIPPVTLDLEAVAAVMRQRRAGLEARLPAMESAPATSSQPPCGLRELPAPEPPAEPPPARDYISFPGFDFEPRK